MSFSLLANPFAVLRATPRTPLAELADLAAGTASPDAPAALRALTVPRTRLPAELAFLPGADDAAVARVLDVLAAAAPDRELLPAALPPTAFANLLAHLCAAGSTGPEDWRDLVNVQRLPGDAGLAAVLDADRTVAGMPPVQPQLLRQEAETLADRHAAALLAACLSTPDPAAILADLVGHAADGAPAAFARKVAAAWARHTAADLAREEEDAEAARSALLATPGAVALHRMAKAVRAWAARSEPQRLSDARAGLDHAPTLRLLRPWRAAVRALADKGHPGLAVSLAETLAASFAALPGEAAALHDEAERAAGLAEERQLDAQMQPLRALVDRLGPDAPALKGVLSVAAFGPGAPGVAGEMWAAFDAAAAACTRSDAPWTLLLALETRLGGEHKPSGAAAALSLHRGLLARAETAGFEALATRLRAGLRGLERAAARWRFLTLKDGAKKALAPTAGLQQALKAARAVLALTDDPDQRAALAAEIAAMRQRVSRQWVAWSGVAVFLAGWALATWADGSYARNPPWRGVTAQPLLAAMLAPAPAILDPSPVLPPPTTPGPAYLPKAPDLPPADPARTLAFPVGTTPAERQPRNDGGVRSLPEARWCTFNDIRLQGAADAAAPDLQPALRDLESTWRGLCLSYPVRRRDEDQSTGEAARFRPRLLEEGRAMVRTPR